MLRDFFVTFGFCGKVKFAPGTMGSFAAAAIVPLFYNHIILLIIVSCVLFFLGIVASNSYIGNNKALDPKEIVIDEVVGMWLCFAVSSLLLRHTNTTLLANRHVLLLLSFLLFRFFDIVKPFPIGFCDKNIKGGLGIMLDDVLASLFAVVIIVIIGVTL